MKGKKVGLKLLKTTKRKYENNERKESRLEASRRDQRRI
jgi:hypothetical protein